MLYYNVYVHIQYAHVHEHVHVCTSIILVQSYVKANIYMYICTFAESGSK